MITICMNAHQRVITDCMTAVNVNAVNDQLLLSIWPICMIIICMNAHQRVITDCMTAVNVRLLLTIWPICMIFIRMDSVVFGGLF